MGIRAIRTNTLVVIGLSVFLLSVLYGSSLRKTNKIEFAVNSPTGTDSSAKMKLGRAQSLKKTSNLIERFSSFSTGYNATHLWSMRLADETYFRVASQIPCRSVEYVGGPNPEKMNPCDQATMDEFSVESTLEAQQWLYEHQHPRDCSDKKIAVLYQFAWSGFGSTVHQIVWAFGVALSQGRIAVYQTPGNWIYGNCPFGTPDCFFLPISNCTIPKTVDNDRVVLIKADTDHWYKAVMPEKFKNRSFNWVRAQLAFYLMRYNPQTLAHVQMAVAQYFNPPSVDAHRPYVATYVRRSDKVINREMSQAYQLEDYLNLFDADARRANISTIYLNSEDEKVFSEYQKLSDEKRNYYRLLTIKVRRDVYFMKILGMQPDERREVTLEFLTDLYIEAHADLHSGTLTSNWCRLVDEIRLVLGKNVPYYTPENRYLVDM